MDKQLSIKDKLTILYHASANKDVQEFEPRNDYPRHVGEEMLVFATPHNALAAMFLAPKGIDVEIAVYDTMYAIFINSTESNYVAKDRGGAIYELPGDTFQTDTIYGMGNNEWYSNVSVRPISKVVYETSLDAMHENGVQVYFVSDDEFQKIRADPGRALKTINRS